MANLDDDELVQRLEAQVLGRGGSGAMAPDAGKAKKCFGLAVRVARRRLNRNDDLGDGLFNAEIELKIQAVLLTPPDDDSPLVVKLLCAADSLLERYQTRTRMMQHLSLAIKLVERSDRIIKEYLSDHLLIYSRAHLSLVEADSKASLDGIVNQLTAFSNVVDTHPELLQLHASLLLRRFRSTANTEDLQTGLRKAEDVLAIPSVGVDTRIYALTNIAELQPFLFDFDRVTTHLDRAVERGLEAKELAQGRECGIADLSFVYGALAFAQYKRYEEKLGLTDLEGSVDNGKKAVELSQDSGSR